MSTSSENLLGKDDVASMRINYDSKGLDFDKLVRIEPYAMFDSWFKEATDCQGVIEANSMAIATVSSDCKPSVRIVLMKGYDRTGFRFFTNYESRKGQDMEKNQNVSAVFYWAALQQQVRIEGTVEKLSSADSTEYFHKRPRASQIGAVASRQSQVIPNSQFLEKKFADLEKEYEGKEIPKPDYWGGYKLKPERFEFWRGGKGRMHDRIVFRRPNPQELLTDKGPTRSGDDGWVYELISP